MDDIHAAIFVDFHSICSCPVYVSVGKALKFADCCLCRRTALPELKFANCCVQEDCTAGVEVCQLLSVRRTALLEFLYGAWMTFQ